jgi:hypothetical protein
VEKRFSIAKSNAISFFGGSLLRFDIVIGRASNFVVSRENIRGKSSSGVYANDNRPKDARFPFLPDSCAEPCSALPPELAFHLGCQPFILSFQLSHLPAQKSLQLAVRVGDQC